MALKGATNEQKIWNFLVDKGCSKAGCAGLMGNLYAESGLRPNNLQNYYESTLRFSDDTYTAAVDSGAYTNFVRDCAGYGLAQWTYWSRKAALLEFAQAAKTSIGDLETQLNFLWKELAGYTTVLSTLKTATTVKVASDIVLTRFERPADQSASAKTKRAKYGQVYYDKYATASAEKKEGTTMSFTPRLTRPTAGNKYYITKSKGGYSNAIKGKPVDSQCDVLSNCVGYAYGRFNEIGGYGCCKYLSPTNAENFMQHKGSLSSGMTPKLGACAVWQKGGTLNGSDGAGHVAIVEKIISDTQIVTSESGYGNVTPFWTKTRNKGSNGNWGAGTGYKFLGFIYNPAVPDSAPTSSGGSTKPAATSGTKPAAKETVYTVVSGDTLSKIAKKYGTTYQKLAAYNGISNPNKIHVGQKIKIPQK